MIEELLTNMGVSLEQYVLIITVLGSIIFMAKDLRLSILILFFALGTEFLIFYLLERDISLFVYALLTTFVILVLTLLVSYSKKTSILLP